MIVQMYNRVPIVSRLEYLDDFLRGLQNGLDQLQLEASLVERKRAFEEEKYKALGRGKVLMKKLSEAKHLLHECRILSEQLGFVTVTERTLTPNAEKYLSSSGKTKHTIFANRFLRTYQPAVDLVLLLRSLPGQELIMPTNHNKEGGVEKAGFNFKKRAQEIGLSVNIVGFMILQQILSH